MKNLILMVVVCLLAVTPYLYNGYKLAGCDFTSNYKCEVIHAIGVIIPPAALVTVWFDDDRK
jgi:hypothetical protein